MSNQAVANETPTAGMIAKPGADGQQPDVPADANQSGLSNEYPNLPAPEGQVGPADEMPSAPGPADAGYGMDSAPPDVPHDAGNDDIMENSVSEAVSAAMGRLAELHSDTYTHVLGDVMHLPPVPDSTDKMQGPPPGYLPPPPVGN